MTQLHDTSEDADRTVPAPDLAAGMLDKHDSFPRAVHPSDKEAHGKAMQILRGALFATYFFACILAIFVTQIVGSPLYYYNREWYYAYMAQTKKSFALTTTLMTQIWGPTKMRISGDESVAGQIKPTADGGVEFDFPERTVLIANHQIYTDWLYLWWVAYANRPATHGHIYIILKESLKWLPFLGMGMRFYGFIFMSRKMSTDRERMAYRLAKLSEKKIDPRTGQSYFDPMWLMLFPEGTNASGNGRRKSLAWAEKNGLKDPEHMLLPRGTGMFFCLNELKGSMEYIYDCTMTYEGIPRGKYGEDLFSLSSIYFEGRPPASVNMYWRRFRLDDIPLDDQVKFDVWLREEWYKKDDFCDQYLTTGRFPPTPGTKQAYIETAVKVKTPLEILSVFSVVGILGLVWNTVSRTISAVATSFGSRVRS